MREIMLDLMSTMDAAAMALNAMADELSAAADCLDGEPVAEAMRGLARRHRVEALMVQGRLAGLTDDYVEQFGPM
ncbi:hypothetical protein Q8W71_27160 [Methylobacterium sp. NEAU 140]|uniref:hypothetical protein n=1 Tax=Methylobacterium sp. NEAU 140 TaxID=3064945 RepID=UPI00273632A1|nr:hypothetical protein [Methylobacterium sp. NEAU 140]MDP4026307.1 hypothetical protein [Methylobacterium sp. NEAU 140]